VTSAPTGGEPPGTPPPVPARGPAREPVGEPARDALPEPAREPLRDPLPDPSPGLGSGSSPDPGAQFWPRGWRLTMLSAGMLAYPSVTAANLSQYSSGDRALAGYLIVAAFACCYVVSAICAARHAWGRVFTTLGVMAALFVAELPFAHEYAFFLCAVVVAFAGAFQRQYVVPIVATGALAAFVVPGAVRSWHSGPGWFEAIAVVFTAVTVYGFSGVTATNRALLEARAEVARLASEAERNRIARDLHDLLGHSLTVITVKSALARRLAAAGSPRALAEISEVEELSRQALADVRAAVTGYREVNLAGELARGRELLRAAGIVADLPTATDMVDLAHRELFGWVVREGVTNVVRHAHATRCTITLSATEVEIRDDGVGAGPRPASDAGSPTGPPAVPSARPSADPPPPRTAGSVGPSGPSGPGPRAGGNGLTGLRERVAAAGGSVEAGPVEGGPSGRRGWRLRVSLAGTGRTWP
jgi:two-component system, NarL family, sensor histidine kinase DesK